MFKFCADIFLLSPALPRRCGRRHRAWSTAPSPTSPSSSCPSPPSSSATPRSWADSPRGHWPPMATLIEATDTPPADTDRADRTREPAKREFSSSVGPGMKARASPAKLESGHQEPLYVRLYCVMMPIALASTMAPVLWYIGVFDQLVITYGSRE